MPDATALLNEGIRAEKLGMLDRALEFYRAAAAHRSEPDTAAAALLRQADVLRLQCDWQNAIDTAREAQAVARRAGLAVAVAQGVNCEASVHMARGEFDGARPLLEEVVRTTSDVRVRGIALQNLGSVYAQQRDLDRAERMFVESFACFQACGYERGQAIALNNQGRAKLDRGDAVAARDVLAQAVSAARHVEDEELIAVATMNLSEATLAAGDYDHANDLVCSALGHFRVSTNRWREVECLRLLGVINVRRGHLADARRCYDHALDLARRIDARLEVANLTRLIEELSAQEEQPVP